MQDDEVIQDSQYSITKERLCLTNLVSFYDGVMVFVDKRRATDVMYLYLYKAFDVIPLHIHISKLERYKFEGWISWCIKNWLNDCSQRVVVQGYSSS